MAQIATLFASFLTSSSKHPIGPRSNAQRNTHLGERNGLHRAHKILAPAKAFGYFSTCHVRLCFAKVFGHREPSYSLGDRSGSSNVPVILTGRLNPIISFCIKGEVCPKTTSPVALRITGKPV